MLLYITCNRQAGRQAAACSIIGENTFQIEDLKILEEVLRMVLEIINSCLTHQLDHNPNLIYALLYNRDMFQNFRVHPSFQDIVLNIESVVTFFPFLKISLSQTLHLRWRR